MIQFDFNWSEPLNLIIPALALLLLPLQLWLILRAKKDNQLTPRHWLRLSLNVLLWLAVVAFIIRPYLLKKAETVTGFLIGNDIPSSYANALADSINSLKKTVSSDIKSARFDTLILAGQDFQPEIFNTILQAAPKRIQWIPYLAEDKWQQLHWKGVVRKGEMQVVQGNVLSSKPQVLKLKYGDNVLDSIALQKGFNQFRLQFPVFTEERTLIELAMDGEIRDTIRFYARPSQKFTFQFLLDSPDFESRALANWLGKAGHAVIYAATLSKNIRSQETINRAKDPDVVVTDAGNVNNRLVKKVLAAGKSVLFINVTKPEDEIKAINASLGTQLKVNRISVEESVSVSPGLTALPFRFVPGNRYFTSGTLPIAVERIRGRVGVSLLNETFPLQLAGDSAAYQKVWDAILAPVVPATTNNIQVQAPLFEGVDTEVTLNGFSNLSNFIKIGSDSVFLSTSPINEGSAKAFFKPTEIGWISSRDSLKMEMFVENQATAGDLYNTARLTNFIKIYNSLQKKLRNETGISSQHANEVKQKLPDWMWFALIIVCFLAVWVERKL
ncbi:hypothetical protein [Dyadobacter chenhuakuii]|uniref:Aerotolerance regulator N-terminal domain-containing protein n=1 Tax=Dyadobacter chenhuakuii TaxID=2909339 RepID=A0ABY4XNL9_9BACT|nr:hypothetical protein [Dyadobacter chenhuakuii]MCF2495034.1 hypothetical protein [Dyadobacter chenhuakuii]USJ31653.1 hypothetical protein NFI80_02715 [Dyadobacter chenhuakuii]